MSQNSTVNLMILAAGHGKRMASPLPKALQPVGNRAMLCHILATVLEMQEQRTIAEIVIVHGSEHRLSFSKAIAEEFPELPFAITYAEQNERRGTGHAVQCGLAHFQNALPLLVLYGDQPLMHSDGLGDMLSTLDHHTLCIAACSPANPSGLGRLIQSETSQITAIVEERDATSQQRQIGLCNAGVMALTPKAQTLLNKLSDQNAAGEYYLTDMVALCQEAALSVAHITFHEHQTASANTLEQLAELEALWQQRARKHFLNAGVQMQSPQTVYFSADTQIASGCSIEPSVVFGRGVSIGARTRIFAFSHIEAVTIGEKCQIGPFCRIRPKSLIGDDVKIGNFVEIKNSTIQTRTRANHHAYLGDCFIEPRVNIGAGTITCNFDGIHKHPTHIGENAFIGTNTSLVAPLLVGRDSIIGAGSVISEDVKPGHLALERNRQMNIKDGARRLRARNSNKK